MRIATWNVNSIRARIDHLTGWLVRRNPDVVCLQETKVEDAQFPSAELADAGYQSVSFGQKTYNGVAILARFGLGIEDVKKGMDGEADDAPRRVLAATIEGIRVINVYVPNGQAVGTDAFTYKLGWFDRLRNELATRYSPDQQLLLCGDFNVAPEPIDVYNPKKWEGQVLCHPDERAALRRLMQWGLIDIYRSHHAEGNAYTWWDYRMGAFKKNNGLRIDLILVTKPLAERCKDCIIDRGPRELDRPSDHTPVVVEVA